MYYNIKEGIIRNILTLTMKFKKTFTVNYKGYWKQISIWETSKSP